MPDRPRLLDLYCKQGGAAKGYHDAGFDVVGVDIDPQPRYPYEAHQGDALAFLAAHGHEYDAWHASPPCRDHTRLAALHGTAGSGWLLAATRTAFHTHPAQRPWVIENVPGAPLPPDYKLCGCMFDLPGLRRERQFETSWHGYDLRPPCHHPDRAVTVAGRPGGTSTRDGPLATLAAWKRAMDIDWMSAAGLAQAIPPAYTQYIGHALLAHLEATDA